MTKYILHGGFAQNPNAENDKFFAEILNNLGNEPRILLVHFAAAEEKRNIYRERDVSQFNRVSGRKKIIFDEAVEEAFIEQVEKADAVYFCGGTTVRLLDALKNFKNLYKAFEGKVVAGESAGANALAVYCYSKSGGGVIKGAGLVPVKMLAHFDKLLEPAKNELEKIDPNLPILALPEFAYRVMEI